MSRGREWEEKEGRHPRALARTWQWKSRTSPSIRRGRLIIAHTGETLQSHLALLLAGLLRLLVSVLIFQTTMEPLPWYELND